MNNAKARGLIMVIVETGGCPLSRSPCGAPHVWLSPEITSALKTKVSFSPAEIEVFIFQDASGVKRRVDHIIQSYTGELLFMLNDNIVTEEQFAEVTGHERPIEEIEGEDHRLDA